MKIWREPRCTLLAGTKINEKGAVLIFQTLHNQAPWCFQDIAPAETNDGIGCLTLTYPKV